jgi:hypothetical protein
MIPGFVVWSPPVFDVLILFVDLAGGLQAKQRALYDGHSSAFVSE